MTPATKTPTPAVDERRQEYFKLCAMAIEYFHVISGNMDGTLATLVRAELKRIKSKHPEATDAMRDALVVVDAARVLCSYAHDHMEVTLVDALLISDLETKIAALYAKVNA